MRVYRGGQEGPSRWHPTEASDGCRMSLFALSSNRLPDRLRAAACCWRPGRTCARCASPTPSRWRSSRPSRVWALSGLARGTISFTTIGLALALRGRLMFGARRRWLSPPARWAAATSSCWPPSSLFAGPGSDLRFPDGHRAGGRRAGPGRSSPARRSARSRRRRRTPRSRARLRGGLPYGPAIAAGGLWVAASLALVT